MILCFLIFQNENGFHNFQTHTNDLQLNDPTVASICSKKRMTSPFIARVSATRSGLAMSAVALTCGTV